MKKILFIMLVAVLLCNCNKPEDSELSYWDSLITKVGETTLSAQDVMIAADRWVARAEYDYTEPNAQGEENISYDYESYPNKVAYGLNAVAVIKFINNETLRRYSDGFPISNPDKYIPPTYEEFKLKFGDDIIYVTDKNGKSGTIKILAYDETTLLVETDFWISYKSDKTGELTEYRYHRYLFKREAASSPNWEDDYIEYDEYLKSKNQ